MLTSGIILLFLIPGIAVYCALFGLFSGDGESIPNPPEAGSIEAVAIVVFACIGVHLVSAALVLLLALPCRYHLCLIVPAQSDLYLAAFTDLGRDASIGAEEVVEMLGIVAVQCVGAYWATRWWLRRAARRNDLPVWIYGWTKDVLKGFDKSNCIVIAYVLTDLKAETKSVVYAGIVDSLALTADATIERINLRDAERYLVDPAVDDLVGPLSRFPVLMMSGASIKNVAFDHFTFPASGDAPIEAGEIGESVDAS